MVQNRFSQPMLENKCLSWPVTLVMLEESWLEPPRKHCTTARRLTHTLHRSTLVPRLQTTNSFHRPEASSPRLIQRAKKLEPALSCQQPFNGLVS